MQMNKILKYLITSIFIAILLVITFFRPLFEVNKATNAVLTITATNEKSDLSWDTEARISQIVVNGQKISPYDITLSDNWKIYDGYLLASYKNQGPSTIKISLNELKTLDIEFIRQVGSGFVNIQIGDVNKTIDLYSAEEWNKYTWHYENEKVFKPFFNIKVLVFCLVFTCISLFIIIMAINQIRLKGNKRIFGIARSIALIQWLVSFYTDKFIFKYYNENLGLLENLMANHKIIFYKSMYLILLIIVWNYISKLYIKIKEKDIEARTFIKYFLPYWIIMIIFLAITWPGVWRWDEFTILDNSLGLGVYAWQHYLTSIIYTISLMIIPLPAGIVLVQITIISVIIGYVVSKFSMMIKIDKLTYLLYVPFILFPVIDQNLYPLRISIYSYLELLFWCKIAFLYYDIEEASKKNILFMAFISALLISWRSEGIILIIFLPISFCILFYKKYRNNEKILYIVVTILASIILITPQNYFMGSSDKTRYSITAYVESLDDLIKVEKKLNPDSNLLKSMEKAIYVNKFLEYESGEVAFWSGGVKENVNEENAQELKKDYFNLVIKYPKEFFSERIRTFIRSCGLNSSGSNQLWNSSELFDSNSNSTYRLFREDFKYNKPVNKNIRKYLINILEGRSIKDYNKTTILYPIMYNLIIPITLILINFIVGIFKRKVLSICISCCMLCQFLTIFLAAPGSYFMYYFPHYLVGYFGAVLFMILKLGNEKMQHTL